MPSPKNLFVDNYDVIRFPLKCIFLFGCYTAKQVRDTMGIDESTYKENLQRILTVITQKPVQENRSSSSKRSKIISVSYDRYDNIANFIVSSFRLKGCTVKQVSLDLRILQLLSSRSCEDEYDTAASIAGWINGGSSVYDRLDALNRLGLVRKAENSNQSRNSNEKYRYTLAPNIVEDMTPRMCKEINDLLCLFRQILPISSLGYMAQETIQSMQSCSELQWEGIFLFKDCFYWQMLDDEVLMYIYLAWEQKRGIKFRYIHSKKDGFVSTSYVNGFPYRVIVNRNDNRQYLFIDEDKGLRVYRLDRISGIKLSDENGVSRSYDISACCSGFIPYSEDGKFKTKTLIIDFYIDDDKSWILRRLIREKWSGRVEETAEKGHYVYTAEVIDPEGLIPWIRTFRNHAVVRKSDEHDVRERIEKRYLEVLQLYGK